MKTAYDYVKELLELDAEILELSNKLAKTANPKARKVWEDEIDRRLSRQLEIKHLLQNINL